jgi:acetyltransferase-like isoleucine patch superfamily enzyme
MRECCIVGKSCQVYIGRNCNLRGVRFFTNSQNPGRIIVGDDVVVNACKYQPTYFNAADGASIFIGNGSLFSNNIELHTTDYHRVYIDGEVSNNPNDITVGSHCWIGLRTVILKGTVLPSNSVVGACSLVNRRFSEEKTLIAGIPAKIVKRAVDWTI